MITMSLVLGVLRGTRSGVEGLMGRAPVHQVVRFLHSWKLTWKPIKGPIKTTVPLKGVYMGFHVSLGECTLQDLVEYSPLCIGQWSLCGSFGGVP